MSARRMGFKKSAAAARGGWGSRRHGRVKAKTRLCKVVAREGRGGGEDTDLHVERVVARDAYSVHAAIVLNGDAAVPFPPGGAAASTQNVPPGTGSGAVPHWQSVGTLCWWEQHSTGCPSQTNSPQHPLIAYLAVRVNLWSDDVSE